MNEEIIMIIFRTILVLVILFILTKVMGKKQVSQMNVYDYLIGITIGSIAADISLDIEKNIIAGISSLIVYGLSSVLVTYLSLKSILFRKILIGTPTILIDNGKIIEKNLKKEGIDINDLLESARENNYFDLSYIMYAILEASGNISFMPKSKYDVVTKEDLKVKSTDKGLCANIIIDSKLMIDNLENMNKDEKWLKKELKKKGYKDYSSILLLTLDYSDNIVIYDKNTNASNKVLE